MKIDRVITGELEENCYILGINDKVLVIDPGDDIDKINKAINNRKVLGVLITHRHHDHIGALPYFSKEIIYDNSLIPSSPLTSASGRNVLTIFLRAVANFVLSKFSVL